MAGYSGTSLVQKLGIKAESSLALLSAPRGFRRQLVGLPPRVRIFSRLDGAPDLVVWFVTAAGELRTKMAGVAPAIERGQGLWIAWPKQSSGWRTDLSEDIVRDTGLEYGLVDYKVCAINEIWSGLKFARRQKKPGF